MEKMGPKLNLITLTTLTILVSVLQTSGGNVVPGTPNPTEVSSIMSSMPTQSTIQELTPWTTKSMIKRFVRHHQHERPSGNTIRKLQSKQQRNLRRAATLRSEFGRMRKDFSSLRRKSPRELSPAPIALILAFVIPVILLILMPFSPIVAPLFPLIAPIVIPALGLLVDVLKSFNSPPSETRRTLSKSQLEKLKPLAEGFVETLSTEAATLLTKIVNNKPLRELVTDEIIPQIPKVSMMITQLGTGVIEQLADPENFYTRRNLDVVNRTPSKFPKFFRYVKKIRRAFNAFLGAMENEKKKLQNIIVHENISVPGIINDLWELLKSKLSEISPDRLRLLLLISPLLVVVIPIVLSIIVPTIPFLLAFLFIKGLVNFVQQVLAKLSKYTSMRPGNRRRSQRLKKVLKGAQRRVILAAQRPKNPQLPNITLDENPQLPNITLDENPQLPNITIDNIPELPTEAPKPSPTIIEKILPFAVLILLMPFSSILKYLSPFILLTTLSSTFQKLFSAIQHLIPNLSPSVKRAFTEGNKFILKTSKLAIVLGLIIFITIRTFKNVVPAILLSGPLTMFTSFGIGVISLFLRLLFGPFSYFLSLISGIYSMFQLAILFMKLIVQLFSKFFLPFLKPYLGHRLIFNLTIDTLFEKFIAIFKEIISLNPGIPLEPAVTSLTKNYKRFKTGISKTWPKH